jgi:hypothetical protein
MPDADHRRRRDVLARLAPAIARTRQCAGEFLLQQRLNKAANASPNPVLDCVEPILEKQTIGGHSRPCRGVFGLAWSPFQRVNAGIVGVRRPGDYANPIPTTSATGPE